MNIDSIKKIISSLQQVDNLETVAPDNLWNLLDDLDAAAAEVQTAVSNIDRRLLAIGYEPAPVY